MRYSPRIITLLSLTALLGAGMFASLMSCGVGVVDNTPSMHYTSTAQGCANFFVYKWNDTRTEALVIRGDGAGLGLSTASRTFDLATTSQSSLHVWIDRYTRQSVSPYCTDVVDNNAEKPHKWEATSGTATVTRDRDSVAEGDTFKVTIKLQNVHLTDGSKEVTLSEESFNDVTVGWLPG
jgi:hypothetical protein